MNLLPWVKIFQITSRPIKLHHITSRVLHLEVIKSNWPKLSEKQSYWVKTEPKSPMRRAWNLYALHHFEVDFEGLPRVQIERKIDRKSVV